MLSDDPSHSALDAVAARPAWTLGVTIFVGLSLLAYGVLALLGLQIIVYDTDHFGDTILILSGAWRVVNGLEPAIDFGFFYGGFTTSWIAAAMQFFGPSVHAYHQATLMMFGAAALAAAAIGWGRLSLAGYLMALLLIATLLFTQHPLESSRSITHMVSTHSFLYNRIGLVQVLLCCLFMIPTNQARLAEAAVGILVGAIALSAAYTKASFAVLPLCLLIGLLIQTRWIALAAVSAALALLVLLFDPGAERFLATISYTQAHIGDRGDVTIPFLLLKSVQLVIAQPMALTVVLGVVAFLLYHDIRVFRPLLGIMAVAAAGVGMGASMGPGGALGQQALPVACALLIVLAALARLRRADLAPTCDLAALVVIASFCLPHLANLAGAHAEGLRKRDNVTIQSGPMAEYLSVTARQAPGERTQYRLLSEGLKTLDELGIGPEYGIVADRGVSFEFARLGKPVPGFPLWIRITSPEFAPEVPMPSEADVVMLNPDADDTAPLRSILIGKMGRDFELCARTVFWEVYVRRTGRPPSCPAS